MQTVKFAITQVHGTTYVPPGFPGSVEVTGETVFLLPTEAEILSDCIFYGSMFSESVHTQDIDRLENLGLVVEATVLQVSGTCGDEPNWEQATNQYVLTPLGYQVAFNLFVVIPEETVASEITG